MLLVKYSKCIIFEIKGYMLLRQPHDNWATYYDFVCEKSFGDRYNILTTANINVINSILPTGIILDFGAGTGRLSFPLTEKGYSVIAVERSIGMVEEFKRKSNILNLEVPIHHCAVSDYKNGKADLALALFTVLSYSTTEDELSKNIKNIFEHLNPNGHFFFDLPTMRFFELGELPFIQSEECRRSVKLENFEDQIYSYKEKCKVNFNGETLEYNDEFKIRYWPLDTLDKLLLENGFVDTFKGFPQFDSTGSTYKLYKKQRSNFTSDPRSLHKIDLSVTLTETFIDKYNSLNEVNKNTKYFGYTMWRLSRKNLNQYLKCGEVEMDFIWHSIVFSLFAKTMYFYSPENCIYCYDFLDYKFQTCWSDKNLHKIFNGKLKLFIDDDICKSVPPELYEEFYNHSIKNIDAYGKFFIDLIGFFADGCCEVNYDFLINKVKEDRSFKDEFSNSEDDLSNIFFKTLLKLK